MDLFMLKSMLDKGVVPKHAIIFQPCEDNSFLIHQYIERIKEITMLPTEIIDDEQFIKLIKQSSSKNAFGTSEMDIKIYYTDNLKLEESRLSDCANLIIIAKQITPTIYDDIIVNIPSLEDWQIKDYIYSNLDGLNKDDLEWLFWVCGGNMFVIENEIAKLSIFPKSERKSLFPQFKNSGVFGQKTNETTFSLINAIITKNKQKVCDIYKQLDDIEISPIGFVTLLYKSVMNIIQIQLSRNPSAETLGLSQKQFYMIQRNIGHYSKDELIYILQLVGGIDYKLKTGELPIEKIIDYVIIGVLSV